MNMPEEVTLKDDCVEILWDDDHRGYFPHRYLRSWCSCAHCVEEGTGRRIVWYDDIDENVQAVDWLQIGRYALQFLWSDFHETGIYPFYYLRDLCQCDACRTKKNTDTETASNPN